jgi:pimeloyl-ACP methyl ester carboxylesterase
VPLDQGDQFVLSIRSRKLTFEVAALADEFPGMGARTDFVVAPYAWLEGIFGRASLRPTVIFVRGDAALAVTLREQTVAQSSAAVTVSRHEAYAAMHEAPLVAGVAMGFLVSLVIAAAYAACVASVILDASAGPRVGFLRRSGTRTARSPGSRSSNTDAHRRRARRRPRAGNRLALEPGAPGLHRT